MVCRCERKPKECCIQNALYQTGKLGSTTTKTSQFSRSHSDLGERLKRMPKNPSVRKFWRRSPSKRAEGGCGGNSASPERQSSQSGFSSKKVRILTKRHRRNKQLGFFRFSYYFFLIVSRLISKLLDLRERRQIYGGCHPFRVYFGGIYKIPQK